MCPGRTPILVLGRPGCVCVPSDTGRALRTAAFCNRASREADRRGAQGSGGSFERVWGAPHPQRALAPREVGAQTRPARARSQGEPRWWREFRLCWKHKIFLGSAARTKEATPSTSATVPDNTDSAGTITNACEVKRNNVLHWHDQRGHQWWPERGDDQRESVLKSVCGEGQDRAKPPSSARVPPLGPLA